MPSTDPFSTVYAAIISALTGSAAVTALVSAANIVRLDTKLEPLIDDRNCGDLPMLRLVPVPGGENNLHASSDTANFVRVFNLEYATDHEDLANASAGLFAIDFAVMRALHTNRPSFGSSYVTKFELGEWGPMQPFEVDAELTQERGWMSTLPIEVLIEVQHSTLLES